MADGERTDRRSTVREIELSHTYFNGFSITMSNADIGILLMLNNEPASAVSMSFSTAKTLAKKLGDMIATLERESGHEIMEIDFLGEVVARITEKRKS